MPTATTAPDTPTSGRPKGPELVIGLVTPIGTDTTALASNVKGCLSKFNYDAAIIKLSTAIPGLEHRPSESEDERVERLINAGDEFCKAHDGPRGTGDPAALARLAVREIRRARLAMHRADGRTEAGGELAETARSRTAYILHSLKRPAEVELLRALYGDSFLLLGAQVTRASRRQNLSRRALRLRPGISKDEIIDRLITRDAEEDDPVGQRVNDTYPESDYFLDDVDPTRFIDLLFGQPIAPTIGEFAMYLAHASQARSLSASRKVGAAIVVGDAVVATGFNDPPHGHQPDILIGTDASERAKQENVRDTLQRFAEAGLLADSHSRNGKPEQETIRTALSALEGGALLGVIEYQRAVHAEAKAIDDATVRGVSPTGGTLFVTTYPCHLCYKHALSVRLGEIRYIDPYSKSRAASMYPENVDKILLPYAGVAPSLYMRVFDARPPFTSDSSGKFVEPDPARVQPLVGVLGHHEVRGEERIAVNGLKEEYR